MITETKEDLQQARINVFIYDSEALAQDYFKEWISDEQWKEQLRTGEGFYFVEEDNHTNTIFLESRYVTNPSIDDIPGGLSNNDV